MLRLERTTDDIVPGSAQHSPASPMRVSWRSTALMRGLHQRGCGSSARRGGSRYGLRWQLCRRAEATPLWPECAARTRRLSQSGVEPPQSKESGRCRDSVPYRADRQVKLWTAGGLTPLSICAPLLRCRAVAVVLAWESGLSVRCPGKASRRPPTMSSPETRNLSYPRSVWRPCARGRAEPGGTPGCSRS